MSTNRFDLIRNKYMASTNQNSIQDLKQDSNQESTVHKQENVSLVHQKDKDANILEQISVYSSNQTEVFIQQIDTELDEQKHINQILKMTDYETNTVEIKEFISNHKEDINKQLSRMESLFAELKSMYEENQILHKNQAKYETVVGSHDVSQVASDLRKLKTLKSDILTFLYSNGIRAPSNSHM